MNVPKVAYRNNIMLFSLPTCSGISYSTAKRFTVKLRASPSPQQYFIASVSGRREA